MYVSDKMRWLVRRIAELLGADVGVTVRSSRPLHDLVEVHRFERCPACYDERGAWIAPNHLGGAKAWCACGKMRSDCITYGRRWNPLGVEYGPLDPEDVADRQRALWERIHSMAYEEVVPGEDVVTTMMELAMKNDVDHVYVVPMYRGLSEKEAIALRFPDGPPREKHVKMLVDDSAPPEGLSPTWPLDLKRGGNEWKSAAAACSEASIGLEFHFKRRLIASVA